MRSTFGIALFALGLAGCETTEQAVSMDAGSPDAAVDAAVAEPAAPDMAIVGPALLSETGLYDDFASRKLAAGVFQYVPRYPLWSDGAEKYRYLLLPPGTKIDTSDMDNWVFPVGTKAWKEFRVGGQAIETRLLQKIYPGSDGWWEAAYVWKADGSDAVVAPKGVKNALGTMHDVPSQNDCQTCHYLISDVLIGVSAIQLSAANGSGPLSQLAAAGALSNPPAAEFQVPGTGVVQDALGYLHGNCGHCHNDNPAFTQWIKLQMRLVVADATPEQTATYRTAIHGRANHVYPPDISIDVVPGAPDQSQLYVRMGLRDFWAMPAYCTKVPDAMGMATVRAWITALPP
jgi:hypothetical protein